MQLTLDLDNTFDYPPVAVPLYWLSNWRWWSIFRWQNHNNFVRRYDRSGRIVRRYFPNGICPADFMEVKIS